MKKLTLLFVATLICSVGYGQKRSVTDLVPKNNVQLTSSSKTTQNATRAGNATIVLKVVSNMWGDGTGYQLLLDADANCFNTGSSLLVAGAVKCGMNYSTWFEHTLPANATTTANMVYEGNETTITVPAGNYGFLILNPDCPEGGVYVSGGGDNCDASNGYKAFLADYKYTFIIDGSDTYVYQGTTYDTECVTLTEQYIGTATANQTDIVAFFMTSPDDQTPVTGTINIAPTESFTFYPAVANLGPNDINLPVIVTMTGFSNSTITELESESLTWFNYPQGNTGITFSVADLNTLFGSATSKQICISITYQGDTDPSNNSSCITLTRTLTGVTTPVADNFNVYPNPAKGNANIYSAENSDVNIYDVTGKLVNNFKINAGETKSFRQTAGVYFVKVNGKIQKVIFE